jgi:hypothetical protein
MVLAVLKLRQKCYNAGRLIKSWGSEHLEIANFLQVQSRGRSVCRKTVYTMYDHPAMLSHMKSANIRSLTVND